MYLDPEHCFKLSQSRIRSTIRIKIGIKINNKRLTEGTQFDKKKLTIQQNTATTFLFWEILPYPRLEPPPDKWFCQ